jgi:phage shock protein C
MTQKLTRSSDKMISGVAAGFANYVGIDPVIARLVFALLILSNPPLGVVVYIILAIVMPSGEEDPVKASANPFSEEEIIVQDM